MGLGGLLLAGPALILIRVGVFRPIDIIIIAAYAYGAYLFDHEAREEEASQQQLQQKAREEEDRQQQLQQQLQKEQDEFYLKIVARQLKRKAEARQQQLQKEHDEFYDKIIPAVLILVFFFSILGFYIYRKKKRQEEARAMERNGH